MNGLKRLGWWVLFVCLISAIPYGVVALFDATYMPPLERMTGTGQLLLTGFAFLGGGVRELHDMPVGLRPGRRKAFGGMSVVFGGFSLAVYGVMTGQLIAANGALTSDQLQDNAWKSVGLFSLCAAIAVLAVLTATPDDKGEGT